MTDKMITLTIDGKSVTVPDGTTVLQACEKAQSPVPFYCYHPGLSIAGNCRICLVEIEGMPKLQISCYMRAAEGMIVHTTSDKTLDGRKSVLEFLLANHPLDCPVCDQAGECWLQDYYMEYGLYDPKFNEQKVKKPKAVPVGPKVMLDAERCILCSRCVRFCDEITKTGEFGIFNRGDHSEIGVFDGKQVDNKYSGCVVDVCPVGALTDRDFRFKCRVWYLGATKSVCPGCSMGCNIEIHSNRERKDRPHIAGGARVMRLKPRHNPEVNRWWMCDEGRYAYHAIDEHRIMNIQIRDGHATREGSWEEAFTRLVSAIQRLKTAGQLDRIGVILSTHLTNEELYLAKTIFRQLGITQVTAQAPRPGGSDDFLIKADKSPNTHGAQALGLAFRSDALFERAARLELSMLYVFGHDLEAVFGREPVAAVSANVEMIVFQGSNVNASGQFAHLVLPSAVYAEKDGTFTNCQGRVQRIHAAFPPLAEAKTDADILSELAKRLGVSVNFPDVQSIFADLAAHEPAFRGLRYEAIGDTGAMLTTVKGEG